jgi:hypothetical protein
MRFIPNAVSTRVAGAALRAQYHSPRLLFAAGVVGIGTTVVLACKSTLKLDELITDAEKTTQDIETQQHPRYSEKDRKHDLYYHRINTGVRIVKLYAPSAAVGVLSIACLTQSNRILTKRNAALTAAYGVIEKAFGDYRQRVRDELGEEKDRHFMHGVEKREIVIETENGPQVVTVDSPLTAAGYAKVWDSTNPNWQTTADLNLYWLKCQQNWLNNRLEARGYVFLNEVYKELGIDETEAGAVVGWWWGPESEGDGFIDFGIFDADNDQVKAFVTGHDRSLLLDFNVDGVIHNKLQRKI